MRLTHLSLFSGIGGIDLAAEWAGFETVAFVEQNAFCQKVLAKHWPGVPIYDDVRTVGPLGRRIDLLSGGFPCQPFSVAGKQRGEGDDRFLWPEMLRVIEANQPAWVVAENVPGIIRMALDDCLDGLESAGYATWTLVVPACGVGAPHRRERVFIVAKLHSDSDGRGFQERPQLDSEQNPSTANGSSRRPHADGLRDSLADTKSNGRKPRRAGDAKEVAGGRQLNRGGISGVLADANSEQAGRTAIPRRECNQWAVEPPVGRVANGVPRRVDRLRALGNAVVPQQVYPILKAISDELRKVS